MLIFLLNFCGQKLTFQALAVCLRNTAVTRRRLAGGCLQRLPIEVALVASFYFHYILYD